MKLVKILYVMIIVISITSDISLAEKSLLYQNDFETTKGLSSWPRGTKAVLDTEAKKTGTSSLIFRGDYNSTVYFYPKTKPGYKYEIKLAYKANKVPITRNGIAINFNKKGGGNGSAGRKHLSFKNITADNNWHEFNESFITPTDANSCQFMLDFYRTTAIINIDDLQIYKIGPADDNEIENISTDNGTSSEKKETIAAAFANGGFEDGDSGWAPWFKPDEANWNIDKTVKHSGEASVLISGNNSGRHFVVRKIGGLIPGTIYKISFWVKTEDNLKQNNNQAGFPAVTFDFFPLNAKPRPYFELNKMRGTKPWKQYAFYAEAPVGTKGAYLCLIHDGGKIWFDDITVEEEDE